jgi:hypothetical protein
LRWTAPTAPTSWKRPPRRWKVKDLTISFMTQKMKVTFDEGVDEDAVMANVLKTAKKVESDFEIL